VCDKPGPADRQTSTMMKHCMLLLLACVCAHAAPLPDGVAAGDCKDAFALSAANLALGEINKDRQEGFVFALHRLNNVNQMLHGETGVVFYLTLDVMETNCHVLSKKAFKDCEVRKTEDIPVYGQCKAAIYINKPHRVVRLYNYNCVVRPVASSKVGKICPDCPSAMDKENEEIMKTAASSMEKYNKDSTNANHFAMLNITRASSSMGMATFYFVEYTMQETICAKTTDVKDAANCALMSCEFAHKGHCKASHSHSPSGEEFLDVECEIFEPEAAEKEKKAHLLGGETDHSHTDGQTHDHNKDDKEEATHDHGHDHAHDHTKAHGAHTAAEGTDHHHEHDHEGGVTHSHAHSHDHGHGHEHEHTHHVKAHDHSADNPNTHHKYAHADGVHTHEHDHEMALDHEHKHIHLHDHEHHHHHHDHTHDQGSHRHPEGSVRMLPSLDQPTTLPAFPDQPVGGSEAVALPLVQDPDIPGAQEPVLVPFPSAISAQCPAVGLGNAFMVELFAEDPLFKAAA